MLWQVYMVNTKLTGEKMSYVSGISIAGRHIATDAPPFIIAELSANHTGNPNKAQKLIEHAHASGAAAFAAAAAGQGRD